MALLHAFFHLRIICGQHLYSYCLIFLLLFAWDNMAEQLNSSVFAAVKQKKPAEFVSCAQEYTSVCSQRLQDGPCPQVWENRQEEANNNDAQMPDSDVNGIRFSFSSSSNTTNMDLDPPYWVNEWSPDREGAVVSTADQVNRCPNQMDDEPDDYCVEFYHWNIELEQKYHPKDSLSNQPYVQSDNRAALFAWLSKVNRSYEFYQETLFLTVNIVDRFLCLTPIALECFQLLGISALFIAAKQLEVYHPSISELLKLNAGTYTKQHFQQMEKIILKQLRFNLVYPTCLFFLEYYAHHNVHHNKRATDVSLYQDRPFRQMTRNLSELCMQDYGLSKYTPSVMALSSMTVIEEYIKGQPADLNIEGLHHLGPSPASIIKQCSSEIWRYLAKVLNCSISELASDYFFESFSLNVG